MKVVFVGVRENEEEITSAPLKIANLFIITGWLRNMMVFIIMVFIQRKCQRITRVLLM